MVTVYVEIHGDRSGSDDPSITCGFGLLGGEAVVIIGQVRFPEESEKTGYISAGGFRKARRAMRLARKFNLPVISFLDTKGADPSLASEENGMAAALTNCAEAMLSLEVSTIAVVTGEANAESAVSMGIADRVLMFQNSVYGVISPEEAAKILYQDVSQAEEVAESLHITALDCYNLGIADEIIQEPDEGAHMNHQEAAYFLRRAIVRHLAELASQRSSTRLRTRRRRYRSMGNSRSRIRNVAERSVGKLVESMEEYFPRRKKPLKRPADEYIDSSEIPF
jgi:acetyl-CoA carboxylase carboxyl transferase alpha subunit